jgi:hypothetical protein
MRRILKVKITKEEKVMIVFEQRAGDQWDEYSLTCSEKALPSFYQAIQGLAPHVIEMCESCRRTTPNASSFAASRSPTAARPRSWVPRWRRIRIPGATRIRINCSLASA